jgi:hypothetical protein
MAKTQELIPWLLLVVAEVHPVVAQLTQPQLVALVVDLQTTEMALQPERLDRVTLVLLRS